MEPGEEGRRCAAHGLAAGPGGQCVVCRRAPRVVAVVEPARGVAARVINWGLALGTIVCVAAFVVVAFVAAPSRSVSETHVAAPSSSSASPRPDPARSKQGVNRELVGATPKPPGAVAGPTRPEGATGSPWREATDTERAPTAPADPATARALEQQREIAEQDRRRHDMIEADMHARAVTRARQHVSVVMYSTSWCGACRRAREYMQQSGIAYVDHDVEHDAAAAQRAHALNPRRSVPVIEVGGRQVLVGFSPAALEGALASAAGGRVAQ